MKKQFRIVAWLLFRDLRLLAVALGACLAAGLSDLAVAVPAFPEGVQVAQPDGTKFQLQLRGDEFFSWHETAEGYAVIQDPADGFWKFARPATDRAEFLPISGARVGFADPASYGLSKYALPDPALLRAHLRQQRELGLGAPEELPTPSPEEQPPEQPPSGIPVSGVKTIKNIVLLACFSDHWNAGGGTVLSTKGRVSVNEYSNLFNQVSHTTDGAVGSVRDYYTEVSYGKLTVQSVVSPWVLLPQNEAYYGANDAYGDDVNPRAMVADALAAADAAGFDFSQGDSDGDGWVDCLTIIHSGHGEELSGNPANCIWSHQWAMSSVVTKDGIKMYSYHTEPALRGNTTSTSIIRIGVICHEMGHFFGLPDLYDYSNTTYGIGRWGPMAHGSWNGSDGKRPAHFCAWSKCFLGFVNPVPVHSQAGLSLARAEDNTVVRLLRDGMSNGEYFLVENRARTGFDNDTTAIFPGTLIYHVDSKSANNDLGTWAHPVVKIEEADGDNSLGSKTAYSEAGDIWTSTSGLAGGFRDQTGDQDANAMLYQATHAYNRTDSATYYSYNRLTNFSAAGSTMTCDVSALKTVVGSQTVASANYTVSWVACSQATKYEIQEGAKATLTSLSDGAEDEEATYENWYLAGTVQRDSGGKRSGSYSYAMHRYYGGKWYSSVQSLTTRKTFKVNTGTVISFYLISHLSSGYGYLECQISNDSGNTWKTLGTYSGYIDPWSQRSYNYTAVSAAGINAGDVCILRFVSNFECTSGWSAFPGYGFALDDISITGTEISGYGGWTTLANNVTATSYAVTGKSHGVHAYRVQAYANGTWQGYGTEGEVTVNNAPVGGAHAITTRTNLSISVSANKLKAGDSDTDGDTLSVTAVSDPQPPGASVSLTGGVITYNPGSTAAGSGSFKYTLEDGYGGSTVVTVSVTIIGSSSGGVSLNLVYGPVIDGADFVARFAGIPGQTYTIESSTSSTGPWVKKSNLTAPTDNSLGYGVGVFEVRQATGSANSGYYRTVYPAY